MAPPRVKPEPDEDVTLVDMRAFLEELYLESNNHMGTVGATFRAAHDMLLWLVHEYLDVVE